MNTTFIITGGAGRVSTSIPALEKYHKLNPEDDFKILVPGWFQLFWSHPILQDRVFDLNVKGTFDNYIKNNKVVSPEPYTLHNFYNQKINLIEAFDEIINNTQDHSDLNNINLYTTQEEKVQASIIIKNIKKERGNKKIVIIQPYGSSCSVVDDELVDRSNRSMQSKDFARIVHELSDKAIFINASPRQFRMIDEPTIDIDEFKPYFRVLMSLIEQCDYFIGCDSVGQHIAKAFNKPGSVIMGATNEINFSYPDHFKVIRDADRVPTYSPWRLSDSEVEFTDRKNDGIMNFSDEDVTSIIQIIREDIQ